MFLGKVGITRPRCHSSEVDNLNRNDMRHILYFLKHILDDSDCLAVHNFHVSGGVPEYGYI
jgi:hypothetical protein